VDLKSDGKPAGRIFVHVKPILPEAAVRDVANVASKNLVADWGQIFENADVVLKTVEEGGDFTAPLASVIEKLDSIMKLGTEIAKVRVSCDFPDYRAHADPSSIHMQLLLGKS
jgi:hypothetical protein